MTIDNMTVTFKVGNANTGSSIINIAGLGAKNFTTADGGALPSGTLKINSYVTATYNSSNNRFELTTTSVTGQYLHQCLIEAFLRAKIILIWR